jgi:hypothetical protein
MPRSLRMLVRLHGDRSLLYGRLTSFGAHENPRDRSGQYSLQVILKEAHAGHEVPSHRRVTFLQRFGQT